jgi:hypothetical protein
MHDTLTKVRHGGLDVAITGHGLGTSTQVRSG